MTLTMQVKLIKLYFFQDYWSIYMMFFLVDIIHMGYCVINQNKALG